MVDQPVSAFPRRYARNVASSYVSTFVVALAGLVVTPVLARGLGPERFGIWVLIGSIAVYADLLQLGLGSATAKAVAEARGRSDERRLIAAVATSFWLMVPPAVLALALAVGFAELAPRLFDVLPTYRDETVLLGVLTGVGIAAAIPGQAITSVLTGLQRYDLLYLTEIGFWLLQAPLWAVIVWRGGGLIALGIAGLVLGLVLLAVRIAIAHRLVDGLRLAPRYVERALIGGLARVSGWLALAQAGVVILYRIDVFVVGIVAGVPAAGVYAVGQKLASAADRAIRPTITGLFPFAAELAERNERERLRITVLTGMRVTLAVAMPICLALIVLSRPAVELWVGGEFAKASDVVRYLALATIVAALTRTGMTALQGAGRVRVPALLTALEAALNLTLSVVLGIWIGLTGVAIATLAAAVAVRLGLFVPHLARELDISPRDLWRSVGRPHLAPTLGALLVGFAVLAIDLPNAVAVFVGGMLMLITYAAIFGVLGLDTRERTHLRDIAGRAIRSPARAAASRR